MKFTVHKSDLLEKLAPAMGTVSNKNTIASIEGVLIETLEGRIRISTYDMNKGVRAMLDAVDIEREGRYIINAQRLYQTIRVMPDDDLTIEVFENCNCTLTCGKASFSMFAMPGAEFPNLPELTTERGFEISSSLVKKMISKVVHSVAELDNRPMLCGCFFKITEGGLELVSCDGYTLSICREKTEIERLGRDMTTDVSFIIPGHALGEISKILSDNEDSRIRFYLSRKHAIIRAEDIVFFTRTIESEYVDYNRMIPRDNDIILTLDRERLLEGLERANIIAEEKIQGSGRSYVKINVEENIISLTSTSVNGKVYDEMDCTHEGGDLEIGFNCRYLINSVKAAEGEIVKVTMKSATAAITIEPYEEDENSSYFYMVLPVRMNNGDNK
jgi:DNA polymerase-3 subunit beta